MRTKWVPGGKPSTQALIRSTSRESPASCCNSSAGSSRPDMIADSRRRLEELLDREIELAHSLAATLAAEKAALTGDSPQAVEQNAAEKIRLFGTIENLEEERRA